MVDLQKDSPFHEFFEPLGEMVVAFSMLEIQLKNAIRSILSLSGEDTVLLVEQMRDVGRRINLFEASLNGKITEPNARQWIKDISEDLRRANSHRNYLVHGPWNDYDVETGTATKLTFKSKDKYSVVKYDYTVENLRDLSKKMLSVIFRIGLLMGYFQNKDKPEAALGTSPGRCLPKCPLSG
jgi:hypothetical protein